LKGLVYTSVAEELHFFKKTLDFLEKMFIFSITATM